MVFKTSRGAIPEAIYPALLFIAAMTALVALGTYQYLSSRIRPDEAPDVQREIRRLARARADSVERNDGDDAGAVGDGLEVTREDEEPR